MTEEAHLVDKRHVSLFQKGFVNANGRELHYRRYGAGPAVVMLHAGPCSARVMAPIQILWGRRFTTIAFDLPGFGLSEMLPALPVTIEALSDAIAAGIRALGLTTVSLYGRHTGAAVAVELASRHRDLCTMVLTDGFPVFQAPYTADRLDEYLQPIIPRWDGTHLVWAWYRYREQHIFWPWDRASAAQRADTDVPGIDFLYRGTLELLEATATYHQVYRAAFVHAGLAMIDGVGVPVCFGLRPGDSQYKTAASYPASARLEVLPREGVPAAERELAILGELPGDPRVPRHRSRLLDVDVDVLTDYIPTRHGATYARVEGWQRTGGTPLLFLHDLPGGITLHRAEVEQLATERRVLGIDLAGNGNSECDAEISIDLWCEQIVDVLEFMRLDAVDLFAHGTSAALALELKRRFPQRFVGLTLRSPPLDVPAELIENPAPDISPMRDGGNFLRLWHHLRDQQLWHPWSLQTRATARTGPLNIDPSDLHERAVTMLKQPQNYQAIWHTVLAYPLRDAIAASSEPPTIVADSAGPGQ